MLIELGLVHTFFFSCWTCYIKLCVLDSFRWLDECLRS